jgi:hypothetical protein
VPAHCPEPQSGPARRQLCSVTFQQLNLCDQFAASMATTNNFGQWWSPPTTKNLPLPKCKQWSTCSAAAVPCSDGRMAPHSARRRKDAQLFSALAKLGCSASFSPDLDRCSAFLHFWQSNRSPVSPSQNRRACNNSQTNWQPQCLPRMPARFKEPPVQWKATNLPATASRT